MAQLIFDRLSYEYAAIMLRLIDDGTADEVVNAVV